MPHHSLEAPTDPAAAAPRPEVSRGRRRELLWLAPVAGAYALVQLLLAVPGTGLGWDEAVYVSQVSRDVPAAFFSAPRARGITYLVAPVVALTSSTTALRVFLALLSAAALLLCLWVWRKLIPVPVLALAGGLFSGLWVSLFYGPQAMPNLWVAFGALLAVGCFLRAARDRSDRRALAVLTASVALAALMRPMDAAWLILPLLCAVLVVPAWRRPALLMALGLGAVLGGLEWVIEAELRYGGLLTRLERASEIQGGLRWNVAVGDQLHALDGRTLCRPCNGPWQPVAGLWWLAVPPLTAGALIGGHRRGRLAEVLLPTVVGLSLAMPYLFLIGYGAARFLLPAYALLSLPVAACLARLVAAGRTRSRALAALCLTLAGCHLAVQLLITVRAAERSRANQKAFTAVAAELRGQGLRPPCVISGSEAVRAAYYTGCASRQTYGGHDGSISAEELAALGRTRPVAVLVQGDLPPPWAARWRPYPLPDLQGGREYQAYLSPSARPGTALP
ncbi:hypothetical protein [Streptomyces xanthophaeus]|uniref:Integral membrane protein n=1 Tax=Streptomyces xanthophaeus TaxID=67385 RepID=A0A919GSM2_9ACTN|nr:hypothetical protein [Streptomyces xanthophaeus]GHI83080.1 hypothetical protein Sxan_04440 [Streptomyces xanthophaeus]